MACSSGSCWCYSWWPGSGLGTTTTSSSSSNTTTTSSKRQYVSGFKLERNQETAEQQQQQPSAPATAVVLLVLPLVVGVWPWHHHQQQQQHALCLWIQGGCNQTTAEQQQQQPRAPAIAAAAAAEPLRTACLAGYRRLVAARTSRQCARAAERAPGSSAAPAAAPAGPVFDSNSTPGTGSLAAFLAARKLGVVQQWSAAEQVAGRPTPADSAGRGLIRTAQERLRRQGAASHLHEAYQVSYTHTG